ncbi:UDP-N-acetylmuramoyl-L-alanyl-D-glutamate--2,6-diaminopimelate ligase [bacterium]|nr:UDP-N-acetylmuramoyl-L-alanyl-D-glutamate--2,6-diaminopimelate ligase [bacterium]
MALPLGQLVSVLPGVACEGDPSAAVAQVTADSREAGPGVLFVAVRGTGGDGHRFLAQAAAAGAAGLVIAADHAGPVPGGVPVVRCADTRPAPALLARALHGTPDDALVTAAVTGTNGKTTTAFLLQALLDRVQGPCGLLGTIRYSDGRESVAAPLTTPGGPVFYAWLGRMRDNGCGSVAMELSSHALDQQRTAGLGLDVAVMTNLGRDHLDYHADLAAYLAAKARIADLLRRDGARRGTLCLNAGDPAFADLATGDVPVLRWCARPEAPAPGADLQVTTAVLGLDGTRLGLDWRGEKLELASPLVGRFNVENLTAALAAGLALGVEAGACCAALAAVTQVPGRLERIGLPQGGIAVVDYAHTHDALDAVLTTCDELLTGPDGRRRGRLLAVFGCGGDRDRGKRPLMAQVVARGADAAWITSDNPRSEDPAAICADITAGFDAVPDPRAAGREVVIDRTAAVEAALAAAGAGDIVVIAGKGHEDYQIVGDRVLDLDDRRIVRDWIARGGTS